MIHRFIKEDKVFEAKNMMGASRQTFETNILGALIDEEFISIEEVNNLRSRIDGVMSLWYSEKTHLRTRTDEGCSTRWLTPQWNGEEKLEDFLKRRDEWINMFIISKVLFDEDEQDDDDDYEYDDECEYVYTREWTYYAPVSFEMVNDDDCRRPHGCNVHPWTEV